MFRGLQAEARLTQSACSVVVIQLVKRLENLIDKKSSLKNKDFPSSSEHKRRLSLTMTLEHNTIFKLHKSFMFRFSPVVFSGEKKVKRDWMSKR